MTKSCNEVQAAGEASLIPMTLPDTQSTPPPTYAIIFDNLDFFIRTHHQSTIHNNQSIHWIHHIAVQDRIPTYHLNNKPIQDLLEYNLGKSLPGLVTQTYMRREFIVIGSRMLTKYFSVLKPFSDIVVHHIPHDYTGEMAQRSIDVSTDNNPLMYAFSTSIVNTQTI